MSNFEEQMRLFEAEVGGAAGVPARSVMSRPAFMPHSVRSAMPGRMQVPPPPSYPRPEIIHPTTARPGVTPLSKSTNIPMKREYAAAPQISKPNQTEDDDVLAKLLKYEKEVKMEKKDKKRKSEDNSGPPGKINKTSNLMQPSKPPVKSGTQVTPDEIRLKAKQMVEMVKASQVIQTKRLLQNQGGGSGGGGSGGTGASVAKEKPGKKPKKMIRMAGGQMWEDASLFNWDPNDFRLFCGDLGNDVTDEVLTRTFSKFTSFQQAKVVRDKRSNKTKGYGFVSFKDPADFTRAIKEMDGKYVGSRPIKLRKSNWKDRNIDQVKHKQKVKNVMGYKA